MNRNCRAIDRNKKKIVKKSKKTEIKKKKLTRTVHPLLIASFATQHGGRLIDNGRLQGDLRKLFR